MAEPDLGWVDLGVRPDASGFGRTLDRQLGPEMDRVSRTVGSRFSSGLKRATQLGGGLALFGGGAFIADAVRLESEFSKTFAQIRVATEASGTQLESLDALAIKLGKDTVFSANEASTAMLELAKNGIGTATIRAGALESALTLAAAGGVELTDAATTMGNALNAFGLKGRQSARVAAALAGAANASSASVGSLAEGLQQTAATANDVGLNVQETTGILAAFANAGISGSDAGTSLKTMLSRLVPETDKAKTAMREYGISFVDANGEFLNAVEIAAELKAGLGDLAAAERSTALNAIFGSDARRAATILTKEGAEGIREYIKATSDQTAAERMAKASMSGTAGAIEELKGSWETLKLEFGKEIAPVAADFLTALADGADDAAPKLRKFGEWIREDGVPLFKDMVEFGGDAAGVIGDIVGFLNKMPSEAKLAGAIALVGGLGAAKLRGGSGLTGSIGSAIGVMKPVPVLVTNPGFGAGGLPGGGKGVPPVAPVPPSGALGKIGNLSKLGALTIGGATVAVTLASGAGVIDGGEKLDVGDTVDQEAFRKNIAAAMAAGEDVRDAIRLYESEFGVAFESLSVSARNALKATAAEFQSANLPTDLKTRIALEGVPESKRAVRELIAQYDLTPKQKRTAFEILGFDLLMDRADRINKALDWAARDRRARISIEYEAQGYETRGGLQRGGGTSTTQTGRSRAGGGI